MGATCFKISRISKKNVDDQESAEQNCDNYTERGRECWAAHSKK